MEIPLVAGEPLVIFYDSCVPWDQFGKMLKGLIPFAEHIFVRQEFSEKICRNDYELFAAAELERQKNYPDRVCIFMTVDNYDFEKQAKRHPAFNKTIKLIVLKPCSGKIMNWLRARHTACQLFEAHAIMWEAKVRRKERSDKYRKVYFQVLEEIFGKKKRGLA